MAHVAVKLGVEKGCEMQIGRRQDYQWEIELPTTREFVRQKTNGIGFLHQGIGVLHQGSGFFEALGSSGHWVLQGDPIKVDPITVDPVKVDPLVLRQSCPRTSITNLQYNFSTIFSAIFTCSATISNT